MLKLDKVTKVFNKGTSDEKKAINNLSLEVNDGDFITIIGSNGAGKSTLFNIISANLFCDSSVNLLSIKR